MIFGEAVALEGGMPQRLRIFVASPGDVREERLRADFIIDKHLARPRSRRSERPAGCIADDEAGVGLIDGPGQQLAL
jgi:hypothetical protein